MTLRAHSPINGREHWLNEHLANTASLAESFATRLAPELGGWGRAAGLLHDLGKATQRFQQYLRGLIETGGAHKIVGAQYALCQKLPPPIALAILGHHSGLPALAEAHNLCSQSFPADLLINPDDFYTAHIALPTPQIPDWLDTKNSLEIELLTRLLFSALVDADALDTIAFRYPQYAPSPSPYPSMPQLWKNFISIYEQDCAAKPATKLNQLRRELFQRCIQAAEQPPGAFSLTAPTGLGKTLSSLGFALKHASCHGLDRIITVIPYISITEQTANVYRQFLPKEAILEHHSAVDTASADSSEEEDHLERWELAAENWDAPIIVTTAVQFFESLFAHKPSRCRKLHRIAHSVVIIDEIQLFPESLLQPTFDMLGALVRQYGVTCLFTTATQPAYKKFCHLQIQEIVPDPPQLAQKLQGLKQLQFHQKREPLSWAEVAEHLQSYEQALCVVNTRADARALYALLPPDKRLHLSTSLCGAHRRQILEEIQRRLAEKEPCLLVSTQLVEAGVDLDFPVVWRAMGPLVSLIQAAGRCNREAKLPCGECVIFTPKEGGCPGGAYRTATETTRSFLSGNPEADLANPIVHQHFFELFYQAINLDEFGIQQLRGALDFPAVAEKYRLIADETIPVAVPWQKGNVLLAKIAQAGVVTRDDLRELQPYFVNLRFYEFMRAQQEHLCHEVIPGSRLWRWDGGYDEALGLQWEFEVLAF